MALRTNVVAGTLAGPWAYNDYLNLLTGVMSDQAMSVKYTPGNNTNGLLKLETDGTADLIRALTSAGASAWTMDGAGNVKSIGSLILQAVAAAPGAPTAALVASSTGLGVGAYKYAVTFVDKQGGETLAGTQASITTTTGNQHVSLTSIPTGPVGQCVSRNIYRTAVGGSNLLLLTSIADNTTVAYTDSTADGSLGAAAPVHPTFGGALYIKDSGGATKLTIASDGSLITSGGGFGISGALYFDSTAVNAETANTVYAQAVAGSSSGHADLLLYSTSGRVVAGYAVNNGFVVGENGAVGGNGLWIGRNSGGTIFQANIGSGGIGFKTGGASGSKIAEMLANGNFIIGGTTYYTNQATVAYSAGGAFDAFDVAEQYETDGEYAYGAVLCPGPNGKLTRCTHDKCRAAMVVSQGGALHIGGGYPDADAIVPTDKPMALVGRVLVNTDSAIPAFAADGLPTLVTSNGNGGVRAMRAGETGYALGFALHDSQDGEVGIVVRPMFCSL